MIVCPWKDLGRYAPIIPGLEDAIKAVNEITDWTPRTIPLPNGNRMTIVTMNTKSLENGKTENHKNFLDIQYVVKGEETMGWAPTETLTPKGEWNFEKDVGFYNGHVDFMRITEGNCYVVYPEDGHMPGVHLDEPKELTKLIIKLKV